MTKNVKNVYLVQHWFNEHWVTVRVFSSEKKANFYISEMAYSEPAINFRKMPMPLL